MLSHSAEIRKLRACENLMLQILFITPISRKNNNSSNSFLIPRLSQQDNQRGSENDLRQRQKQSGKLNDEMDLEESALEKVYCKTKRCTSNYDRNYHDRDKSVSSLKRHSIEKQRHRQNSPYKSDNQPPSVGHPQDHVCQSTSRRLS